MDVKTATRFQEGLSCDEYAPSEEDLQCRVCGTPCHRKNGAIEAARENRENHREILSKTSSPSGYPEAVEQLEAKEANAGAVFNHGGASE